MFLVDRLSSKFHKSFASRPTDHFSDNLTAADIISSDIPAVGRGLFTKYSRENIERNAVNPKKQKSCQKYFFPLLYYFRTFSTSSSLSLLAHDTFT